LPYYRPAASIFGLNSAFGLNFSPRTTLQRYR